MSCLACAVVFCTVYALILPAITAENTPQCGQEEHVHTEACYAAAESGRTLVCTPETLGVHQHTADCLGAEGEYVCGYANFVIHHHDTACYDASGVLWCPLPEVEEHTHSEACYQAADSAPAEPVHTHTEECYTTERGELTCTLPEAEGHAHSAEAGCYDGTGTLICQVEESAGHQHTDQCYAQTQVLTCALPTEAEAPAAEPAQTEPTEPVLICGRQEIVLHQHGPGCYDGTNHLICGQVQVLAHQHTDQCFQTTEGAAEPVLTCQLAEHTHTAQCFLRDGLTAEEWAQVDSVNALLAALPGREEIEGKMTELAEAGDEEGSDAYLTQLIQAVQEAQTAYDALTETQREKVTGAQRLEDLAWLQTAVLPETKSGNCGANGDNVTWTLADGVLTISGTGAMKYYTSYSNVPWYSLRDQITSVTVESGVTTIGIYAFYGCTNLTSVTIPEGVTSIGNYAFYKCTSLTGITLPEGVTSVGNYAFYNCTSLTSVILPDGVTTIGNYAFSGCSKLTSITLPDSVTSIGVRAFASCSSLSELNIPVGITQVPGEILSQAKNLETLYWDAADASFDGTITTTGGTFQVVLGDSVERFDQTRLAALLKMGCTSLELSPNSHLTLGPLTADFLPPALNALPEGENLYYVDESGVLYRVDEAANTACLVYCPPKVTGTYTVPAVLRVESGGIGPTVVGVDTYAFQGSSVAALTFESPDNIIQLKDFAFCGAASLASINDQTTKDQVLALFTKLEVTGTGLFTNTQITDSTGSDGDLTWNAHGLTLTVHAPGQDSQHPNWGDTHGVYRFYTGEKAGTEISISNPGNTDSPGVVRVYFRMDNEKGALTEPIPTPYPGKDYTYVTNLGSITVRAFQTSVPNCYCLEIKDLKAGQTISFSPQSGYPSPASSGGSATVWGAILTQEEAAALGSGLTDIGQQSYTIRWETQPNTFVLEKKLATSGSLKLVGNGDGGAYISGMSYKINLTPQAGSLEGGVGADYITYVDFTDTLSMPVGARITQTVAEAIREGAYTSNTKIGASYAYTEFKLPDGTAFLTINGSNKVVTYFSKYSLGIGENGELLIRWRYKNESADADLASTSITLMVADNVVELPQEALPGNGEVSVTNQVEALQHFTWSEDKTIQASDTGTTTAVPGSLKLAKDFWGERSKIDPGEAAFVRITAENPGLTPYEGLAVLKDPMPNYVYLSAVQLAAAFQADLVDGVEDSLTVTISKATLCSPLTPVTVTGIDGRTTDTIGQQNTAAANDYIGCETTDGNKVTDNATLTLTWAEDRKLRITAEAGSTGLPSPQLCAPTPDGIQTALENLGYLVTRYATYELAWNMPESYPLEGGRKIEKAFEVTLKDTFMMLEKDEWVQPVAPYAAGAKASNNAHACNSEGKIIKSSASRTITLSGKFTTLDKAWYFNGQSVDKETQLEAGSILDYQLVVQKPGYGAVGLLPLVDKMKGAQVLLVPVEPNKDQPWAKDCDTFVTVGTTKYYSLERVGTYKHVWTSDSQMADQVVVEPADNGLTTQIYWYFTDFSGPRTETIRYKSQVRPDLSSGLSFSVGNDSWLGDHETHRLYDWVAEIPFTVNRFTKRIIPAGADRTSDKGESHSLVHAGESVTYRLQINGLHFDDLYPDTGGYPTLTLSGKDITDLLPKSLADSKWQKAVNVRVEYGEFYPGKVECGEDWTIEDVEGESGQQRIVWGDQFKMTFTSRADIYVTLTFPNGEAWENYTKSYSVTGLANTFLLCGSESTVTHDLAVTGNVQLQKGVWGGGYMVSNDFVINPHGWSGLEDARFYYSNRGVKDYGVLYYVSLYNDGPGRLYLTDMQDRLPQGFTLPSCNYEFLTYGSTFYANCSGFTSLKPNKIKNYAATVYTPDGEKAEMMNVAYTISPWSANGAQYATIQFKQCEESSNTPKPAGYDEARGLCYLEPGQAIVFTYLCNTNDAVDTDPLAENTIAMAYPNFTGGGVRLAENSTTVVYQSTDYPPNDGDCRLETGAWAKVEGFPVTDVNGTWLTSQVAVQRGEIKPGITKQLVSATSEGGITTQSPIAVGSSDTLNWKITADNGGSLPITDYVLTDVMQAPYQFCENRAAENGYFDYTIFGYTDSGGLGIGTWKLFKIQLWNSDKTAVTIETRTSSGGTVTRTVQLDESVELTAYNSSLCLPFVLRFSRDAADNLVMYLHLEDKGFSIPAGGQGVLNVSTVRGDTTVTNKQYRNTAYITPNGAQPWDGSPNHGSAASLTTPYFGGADLPSVRASAIATTSYGYVTTSSKSVTEIGSNPSNTASSTGSSNYIALSAREKGFTYTLMVDNTTGEDLWAMEHLVLIDCLPDVEDHVAFNNGESRDSQFKVSLAEDLNPIVTVTPKGGAPQVLDPGNYRLEYSTETEMNADDWEGTAAPGRWSETAASNSRSVRLVILDEDAATSGSPLIPANSTVSLSFNCKVDDPGSVQPGQIAWNDFGYRYKMADDKDTYLEAAPLPVGVKVPSVPKLVKKLVDHGGNPVAAEQAEEFTFLVYQGAALVGEYATGDALKAELTSGSIPYYEFRATVLFGESQSEPVTLEAGWTWVKGDQYTVVELLPENSAYSLRGFGMGEQQSYTFTYDPAVDQTVVCTNLSLVWDVELIKKGYASESGGTVDPFLPGAVFALYSPKVEDKITDEALAPFSDLNIAQTLTRDEIDWYLKAVGKTDRNGTLRWENLTQESYYLVEVKAPDGYLLPETPEWLLQRSDERDGVVEVEIRNSSGGYELPQAGGSGVYLQTFCGLTLMAGPLVCWTHKRRRGAEKR